MAIEPRYGRASYGSDFDTLGDAPERYLTLSDEGMQSLIRGLRMEAEAPALPIAAVRSLSDSDFPGHLAAVVYCGRAPTAERFHRGYSWHALEYFLARWCRTLSGVVLHDDEQVPVNALAAAMHRITDQGFRLALYTPASQPERLRLLRPFVDWISLEVAPGRLDKERLRSIELLVGRDAVFECRTEWRRSQDFEERAVVAMAQRLARRGVRRLSVHADSEVVQGHGGLWERLSACVPEFVLRERS